MLWVSCTCVQGSRKWDCSKQESWAYVFQTLFTWQVDDGSSSEFEESWLLPAAEELNLLASDRKLGPLGWFTGVQCNNQAGPTQGNTLPPANGNIFVGNSKALCQKRMPAALCNTRPSWRAEHDIDHWREAGPDGSNIATFMASTSHASHATSLPQGHSASFAPASNINGTGGHLKEMQIERMEKEWCHFLCDLKSSRFASNKTNKYKQLSPAESGGTERLLTMIWAVNNFHSSGSPPVCCRRKWPPQKNKNDKRWFQNLSGELELPLSLTAHQSCLSFHGILISKVAGFRSSPLLGLKSLTLEICEYEMLKISKSGADVERNLSVRSSWWHCDLPWVPTHRWCLAIPRWHETWVAMSLQLPHPFQSPEAKEQRQVTTRASSETKPLTFYIHFGGVFSLPNMSYVFLILDTSTAQGGGGSFKNRKRIEEIDCCEWRMSEQKHWPTD